jgi:hypothetical protein
MRRESFEHFYLTKVALGEGCGCAEHATRISDIERHAAERPLRKNFAGRQSPVIALLRRIGLRLIRAV